MKYILALVFITFIFYSCGNKKNDGTTSDTNKTLTEKKNTDDSKLKFSDKSFLKSFNNCSPADTCTYFKVDYIEAASGKNKDKVNRLIMNIVNFSLSYGDTTLSNIQAAADSFMTQYASMRKEFPESPQYWYLEESFTVANETPKIITFASANSSYMGGAHPNSYLEYINISNETGDTLSLNNLFAPGFEKKLNALIDAEFRKVNNLKPGDDLAEKGGLFDNKIAFNYNWMVTKEGTITFYYNPYEIASYAQGPIEVTLTKEQIAPLLSDSSPLK